MRATSMAERGTGTMSVLTLGFATGAVGAARGGREMNNALVDAKEKAEPLEEAIGRANLSAEHFGLLVALDLVRPNYIYIYIHIIHIYIYIMYIYLYIYIYIERERERDTYI